MLDKASHQQQHVCDHNGIYTQDIVVNTGASKTLVRSVCSQDVSERNLVLPQQLYLLPTSILQYHSSRLRVQCTGCSSADAVSSGIIGWGILNLMDLVKLTHLSLAIHNPLSNTVANGLLHCSELLFWCVLELGVSSE